MRFLNDVSQVPMHCITQGVGTDMKSKAQAVAASIEDLLLLYCPASAADASTSTFIVDEAAARAGETG